MSSEKTNPLSSLSYFASNFTRDEETTTSLSNNEERLPLFVYKFNQIGDGEITSVGRSEERKKNPLLRTTTGGWKRNRRAATQNRSRASAHEKSKIGEGVPFNPRSEEDRKGFWFFGKKSAFHACCRSRKAECRSEEDRRCRVFFRDHHRHIHGGKRRQIVDRRRFPSHKQRSNTGRASSSGRNCRWFGFFVHRRNRH